MYIVKLNFPPNYDKHLCCIFHSSNKGPYGQNYGFPSSHIQMWELDHKERWAPKWCFQTVGLEKTLESPVDCKEIKPVNPKETNSEYSLEGLMRKLQLQYFWTPDAKSQLTGKDSDTEKDWRQEEKGATENEMVGWYH